MQAAPGHQADQLLRLIAHEHLARRLRAPAMALQAQPVGDQQFGQPQFDRDAIGRRPQPIQPPDAAIGKAAARTSTSSTPNMYSTSTPAITTSWSAEIRMSSRWPETARAGSPAQSSRVRAAASGAPAARARAAVRRQHQIAGPQFPAATGPRGVSIGVRRPNQGGRSGGKAPAVTPNHRRWSCRAPSPAGGTCPSGRDGRQDRP